MLTSATISTAFSFASLKPHGNTFNAQLPFALSLYVYMVEKVMSQVRSSKMAYRY